MALQNKSSYARNKKTFLQRHIPSFLSQNFPNSSNNYHVLPTLISTRTDSFPIFIYQ